MGSGPERSVSWSDLGQTCGRSQCGIGSAEAARREPVLARLVDRDGDRIAVMQVRTGGQVVPRPEIDDEYLVGAVDDHQEVGHVNVLLGRFILGIDGRCIADVLIGTWLPGTHGPSGMG